MKLAPALLCALLCGGILRAQVAGAPGERQSRTSGGVIEGTVINEVTREPVRGAQIVVGSSANVPAEVTDANGHFVFRNLEPGAYFLVAQHPEFPLVITGLAASRPLTVNLTPGEQKRDVVMALTPGGSITGRIVDEDRKPVAGCYTQALQYAPGQSGNALYGTRNATSDKQGVYRIHGLARGHYYISVECPDAIPVAHPGAPRGSGAEAPKQKYAMEFYPDSPDAAAAARLTVEAGASVGGIDFQLHATSTVTIQGRLTGEPEALNRNLHVDLAPRDPSLANLLHLTASVDTQTGAFHIPAVPAGAYTLIATAFSSGRNYQAKELIDIGIGAPPPAPIEIPLIPGGTFSGSIEVEGGQPAPENLRVVLTPLDAGNFGQPSDASVARDGAFSISGVLPGRWRLELGSANGYVKSLSLGGQEVSPDAFYVAPGAGGEMRVVMGTKMAQLEGSVSGLRPEDTSGAWLVLAPEDPDKMIVGRLRNTSADRAGRFHLSGLEPGHYRLYALAGAESWAALRQNPRVFKAIEQRGTRVDLEAGGRATVQVNVMPADELELAFREFE